MPKENCGCDGNCACDTDVILSHGGSTVTIKKDGTVNVKPGTKVSVDENSTSNKQLLEE